MSEDAEEFVSIVIVDNILPPCASEVTCFHPIFTILLPCLVNLYPWRENQKSKTRTTHINHMDAFNLKFYDFVNTCACVERGGGGRKWMYWIQKILTHKRSQKNKCRISKRVKKIKITHSIHWSSTSFKLCTISTRMYVGVVYIYIFTCIYFIIKQETILAVTLKPRHIFFFPFYLCELIFPKSLKI